MLSGDVLNRAEALAERGDRLSLLLSPEIAAAAAAAAASVSDGGVRASDREVRVSSSVLSVDAVAVAREAAASPSAVIAAPPYAVPIDRTVSRRRLSL